LSPGQEELINDIKDARDFYEKKDKYPIAPKDLNLNDDAGGEDDPFQDAKDGLDEEEAKKKRREERK
jgi:hypothetical protein